MNSLLLDVLYGEMILGRHVPDAIALALLHAPGQTTNGLLTMLDLMRTDAARRLVAADAEGGAS